MKKFEKIITHTGEIIYASYEVYYGIEEDIHVATFIFPKDKEVTNDTKTNDIKIYE